MGWVGEREQRWKQAHWKFIIFANCTKFCAHVVTKFRRTLLNSVEYRGIPQKLTVSNSGEFRWNEITSLWNSDFRGILKSHFRGHPSYAPPPPHHLVLMKYLSTILSGHILHFFSFLISGERPGSHFKQPQQNIVFFCEGV